MAITDDNNCISSNLRADIMRCSMENKNLLTTKGSIYVGAGSTVSVGGQSIPKTKALALGAEGAVLMSKNGDLAYSKLTNDNFDGSTNYSNLEKTFNDYKVVNSNFSADVSYSNIKLSDANFSESEYYPRINFLSTTPTTAEIGNSGTLSLGRDNKTGELSLTASRTGSVYMTKIGISGMGATVYYTVISGQEARISDLSSLKSWLEENGNPSGRFVATGGSPYENLTLNMSNFIRLMESTFQVVNSNGTYYVNEYYSSGGGKSWPEYNSGTKLINISYSNTRLI